MYSDEDDPLKSKLYFSLGEATDDVTNAIGAGDTAVAGAKLVGKALSNTAVFVGKCGWAALKEVAQKAKEAKGN